MKTIPSLSQIVAACCSRASAKRGSYRRRGCSALRRSAATLALLGCATLLHAQVPQLIQYQGRVTAGGTNFTGTGQFKFALVNAGATATYWSNGNAAVSLAVSNGLYAVLLGDSGQLAIPVTVFTNSDVRLRVQFNDGVAGFQTFSPNQRLAAVGYAVVTASHDPTRDVFGRRLNVGYGHLLAGNWTTIAGGSNNLVLADFATVGGGLANVASGIGATIGGGGYDGEIVFGNNATGAASTVAGGNGNRARGNDSAIGGGESNTAAGLGSTVAGGLSNTATNSHTTVGGGFNNRASATDATVGGGGGNEAAGARATVAGGDSNTATGDDSTVAGGAGNLTSGNYAAVVGGWFNKATNSYATVLGGRANIAGGQHSLAAGRYAEALHDGAFVWADSTATTFQSTGQDQFIIRATGGVGIGTTSPGGPLHILTPGAPPIGLAGTNNGLLLGIAATNSYKWVQSYGGPLVFNPQGNNVGIGTNAPVSALHVNGTVTATSFNPPSDRNLKENFVAVDGRAVLERLARVPISRWNFKEDPAVPHLGPVAQDFYAAFNVGTDERHIATVDADGVALAAIQGLYEELKDKDHEIAELRKRLEQLERRLEQ